MNSYFVVVGTNDKPIYETEFIRSTNLTNMKDLGYLHQSIAHAAIDQFELVAKSSSTYYLKVIDQFNEWLVSGFLTGNGTKFLLLHDYKSDDGIKNFMYDAHDAFCKETLNPFYKQNNLIESSKFDNSIKLIGRKYL